MSDTLSTFGYAFQTKILTALLLDKEFIEQINDVLNVDYFDSDSNK